MRQSLLFLLAGFLFFSPARANRGDLISYEPLRDWDGTQLANYFIPQFEGMFPPESRDSLKAVITELVENVMAGKHVVTYRVIYKTIDHYGNPTQASGLVVLPDYKEKSCELPVFLYAHGTIFDRFSAPSRPDRWGLESFFTYVASAFDYIAVAPDYYGMGDGPGFHHHNSAQTNASSSIDMIRAGRLLAAQKGVPHNGQVFLSGYSEGGHAAMGIMRMIHRENLRNEFNVVRAGCGSGAYDMFKLSYDYIINDPYYPTSSYILYLAATCQDIYGELINEAAGESYSTYLKHPYDSLAVVHLLGQDGNLGWVPSRWTDMFQPGKIDEVKANPNHPLRTCLKKSNLYDWPNPFTTIMYFTKGDEQVYWRNAPKARLQQQKYIPWFRFWDRFKLATLDVTGGREYPDHATAAIPSMLHHLILSNLENRFRCTANSGRLIQPKPQEAFIMNFDGSVDIPAGAIQGLQKAELLDVLKFNPVQIPIQQVDESANRLKLPETYPGVYLLRLTDAEGKQHFRWQLVNEPQFVETADYNPITRSTDGAYLLDLTLLEDQVGRVALYTAQGQMVRTFEDPFVVQELAAAGTLPAGDYVVEVHGATMRYYLEMKVDRLSAQHSVTVSPNPFKDVFTIEMNETEDRPTLKVYGIDGREFDLPVSNNGRKWSVNASGLSPGVYVLQISTAAGKRTEKIVKQ